MKRLIINADDLGLTRGVNHGIVRCHTGGILTSATIMPTGRAFEHALGLVSKAPELGVGVHLSLTGGRNEFLTAALRNHPRSCRGFRRFLQEARSGRVALEAVEAEIDRQIAHCKKAGLRITHIDSHHHIHLYPPIMQLVLKVADNHGLSRIRILREYYPVRKSLKHRSRYLKCMFSRQTVDLISVTGIGKLSQKKIKDFGFRGPDSFFGTYLNAFPGMDTFNWILDCIPEGTTELMVHPGICDHELMALSKLNVQRAEVMKLLTATQAREAVEKKGIRLISYADL